MISLLRFLFVVCILFVFRRLLGMLFGGGTGSRQGARRGAPRAQAPAGGIKNLGKMVKDPVCGTYVDPTLAITLVCGGEIISFCSAACRDQYLGRQSAAS
jgi:hypothetical protein